MRRTVRSMAVLALSLAALWASPALGVPQEALDAVKNARSAKNQAETEKWYRQALEVLPGDAYRRERHAISLQIADIEVARGSYGEAIALGESIVEAAREAQDYDTLSRALDRVGYAYRELGDFEKAKEAHLASLQTAGRIDDPFAQRNALARVRNLLGTVEVRAAEELRWQYDETRAREAVRRALEYLGEAFAIAEGLAAQEGARKWSFSETLEHKPSVRIGWIRQAMTNAQVLLGELLAETTAYLGEAEKTARLAVQRYVADNPQRASSLHFLARVLARQEKFAEAIAALEEAEAIWTAKGRPYNIAYAYTVRASEIYGRRPETRPQALEYYGKARAEFLQWGRCNDVAAMEYLSGLTLERLGRKDEAKQAYLVSIELYERLRASLNVKQRLDFFAVRLRPYEALIRLLFDSWRSTGNARDAEQAFILSERARARSLLDTMEAALRPAAAKPAAAESGPDACKPSSMPQPDQRAYGDFSGLGVAKELQIKRVQDAVLRPGKVLLEYFVGEDASYAFVLSETRLDLVRLEITRRDLARRMLALNDPIRRVAAETKYEPLRNYDLAESHRLYRDLVQPLEPLMARAKELIIVPHRTLFYLPFEALVADTRGVDVQRQVWSNFHRVQYFLDQAPPIRYALSATLLLLVAGEHAAPKDAGSGKVLAILNPPNQDRRVFPPLREFEEMWPDLKRQFSGIVDGRGARGTKDLFYKEGDSSELVILGVHGVFNEESPLQSRIVLSGGDLTAQEIMDRLAKGENIPARLITLAACQLGRGQIREGEGLVGLTRALQFAGSKRIVAALWSVDVKPTANLVVAFHQAIGKAGMLQFVDAALLDAKKSVRNSNQTVVLDSPAPLAHPFFWAGMVIH